MLISVSPLNLQRCRFVSLAVWAVVLAATCGRAALATEWTPIFDGQTLAGWKVDAQWWRVEDGSLVGEIPAGQQLDHNTWAIWQAGQVEDFELRCRFRLVGKPAANSGIQFRCQAHDVNHVSGYQADLDMGAIWLGRIYDEHGRALLTERGTRVRITEDGKRETQRFANPSHYAVLFRENDWNDYRIVACGTHISVEINGTLFSELMDAEQDQRDLTGQLALQLHSGPETRIEFRDLRLRRLQPGDHQVEFRQEPIKKVEDAGIVPRGAGGRALNLGFEDGSLRDWTASGDAFDGQPVDQDGIARRWPGQTSAKNGQFLIGGYERIGDRGTGQLRSIPFAVSHPYASYLFAGGTQPSTRCEILLVDSEEVIHSSSGANREQMVRAVVDLRPYQGKNIQIRLVDENTGAWGHLNFDDFRFHDTRPQFEAVAMNRIQENPILSHLRENPIEHDETGGGETLGQMYLPPDFVAEIIAAEPALHQPIAFTFDERGRIWVVEGNSYPQKRPPGEGEDRVLIFSDPDGDGRFEQRKIFIEGLNLVSGIAVGHGGIWIGAAPELLFVADRNRDDRPDSAPVVLLEGFGYQDTHETLNSLVWGPDGWLYGNQGVFNYGRIAKPGATDAERTDLRAGVWRYHPLRHEFEVFAHGGSNQWGLDFNEVGQLFMTHCRSYWGRGSTTHVIQGGHYWNQSNRHHASFVSGNAPADYPFYRNYLLASARYGHGEGGAGKPGSRAVFGGHSHVGTMIYLGDNWPDDYRDHLFSHNLHGHQINQQINQHEGSGYNTIHAGKDTFYCADPQYIGVDLKYGPDGAVYMTDWHDVRHCHNPNKEQWDRTNGRIYRVAYRPSYKPVQVNLLALSDEELVELQLNKNEWYVRTARRLLQERAVAGQLTNVERTRQQLRHLATQHPEATRRLRGLWALHAVGGIDPQLATALLADNDENVRGWMIQLLAEQGPLTVPIRQRMVQMAHNDASPVVRLFLASAAQRLDRQTAWQIVEELARHARDRDDRNLSRMIWFAAAGLMPDNLDRAFQLAESTSIPALSHYVYWYAAKRQGEGLDRVIQMLSAADGQRQRDLLVSLSLGLQGQRGLKMPDGWRQQADSLYGNQDVRIRRLAENLGAVFGDQKLFPIKRRILADRTASLQDRRHAFAILTQASDQDSLPLLLELLDDPAFRSQVIPQLARFDDRAPGRALIERFASFSQADKAATLNTLTTRESLASLLLDALEQAEMNKEDLSAYYVRQMIGLKSPSIEDRLSKLWGKVGRSSEETQAAIVTLERAYAEAPVWAYSRQEGQKHFQKLCATCHQATDASTNIGPNLVGAGSKGVKYFVENVLDPNAVIGNDYRMLLAELDDGRVISGIIEKETDTAITFRTQTESVVVAKDGIEELTTTEQSLMPVGLLETLNQRQVIELLKYLTTM